MRYHIKFDPKTFRIKEKGEIQGAEEAAALIKDDGLHLFITSSLLELERYMRNLTTKSKKR